MLHLYFLNQHIWSENLCTFSCILTFPMQITCVFLGENWKGIFRGLGKATTHISATESCFLIHSTEETLHCVLAGEGRALFNITVG